MIRTLAAVLAFGTLSAAAPPAPGPNFNAFGIAALQRLAEKPGGGSVVISPLSIGVALSMLADGAAGATRTQILRALRSSGDSGPASASLIAQLRSNPDAKIGIANAIWTRADILPSPSYLAMLRRDYGANAEALHFGQPSAANAINAWTSRHTLGLIRHIVDETSARDFLYLTNALAFQGTWAQPFMHNATRPQIFKPAEGKPHEVPMMHQTAAFDECDFKGFRVLRMPYGQGGFAAYVALPDGGSADPLLRELTAAGLERAAQALKPVELSLALPRFTARYESSLVTTLQAMGVTRAFDGADLSVMHAPPPRLRVSSVTHAAYVRVDEDGTVAAAATSVGVTETAIRKIQAEPFIVDRPFVFAIRDERSGNLLFLGIIRDV